MMTWGPLVRHFITLKLQIQKSIWLLSNWMLHLHSLICQLTPFFSYARQRLKESCSLCNSCSLCDFKLSSDRSSCASTASVSCPVTSGTRLYGWFNHTLQSRNCKYPTQGHLNIHSLWQLQSRSPMTSIFVGQRHVQLCQHLRTLRPITFQDLIPWSALC